MSPLRRCLTVLVLGSLLGPAAAQDPAAKEAKKDREDGPGGRLDERRDLTVLRRVSEKTFYHEVARIAYTVPEGWKEIRPHQLERKIDPRYSTVLGIVQSDKELVATLYWIQMTDRQPLSHWVRETATGGEYGEEYETLKTVYGKDRVTAPVRFKSGPFDVYRINIAGGPTEKYEGVLFLFGVDAGSSSWLVKARISMPKGDRARNDAWAQEVLSGFQRLMDAPDGKKAAAVIPASDKR